MSEKNESNVVKSRPIQCVVTSDKMNKSRVGTLERTVKHPQYGKYMRRRSKFMFHDENNETKVGDKVLVVQSRPLSASKRFTLLKVVEKAKQ
jgi:small subunit ribosomal protein S17